MRWTRIQGETYTWVRYPGPLWAENYLHPEKIEILEDADFLMLHGQGKISDDCLRAAKKLRLKHLFGAGYDKVNLSLLAELGMPLANMPGEFLLGVAVMIFPDKTSER